jgi:hypothetical protein
MNAVHTPHFSLKIHYDIILPSWLRSLKMFVHSGFWQKCCVHYHLSHECYVPHQSHLPWFDGRSYFCSLYFNSVLFWHIEIIFEKWPRRNQCPLLRVASQVILNPSRCYDMYAHLELQNLLLSYTGPRTYSGRMKTFPRFYLYLILFN